MKKIGLSAVALVLLLLVACTPPSEAGLIREGVYGEDLSIDYIQTVKPSTDDPAPSDQPEDMPEGAVRLPAVKEVEVKPWQIFEWNYYDDDAWQKGKGVSPDGLWEFKLYSLTEDKYVNARMSDGSYLKNCMSKNYFDGFRPPIDYDLVKVFTCPSGGTIRLETLIGNDLNNGNVVQNGSSLAIYLDGEQVYPTDGSKYEIFPNVRTLYREITLNVKKNQKIYIHLGSLANTHENDVSLKNRVVYKSVNDSVATWYLPRKCEHKNMLPAEYTGGPGCLRYHSGCLVSRCADCIHCEFEIPDTLFNHKLLPTDSKVIKQPTLSSPGRLSGSCPGCGWNVEMDVFPGALDQETGIYVEIMQGRLLDSFSMELIAVKEDSEVWNQFVVPYLDEGEKALVYRISFLQNGEHYQYPYSLRVSVPRGELPYDCKVLRVSDEGVSAAKVIQFTDLVEATVHADEYVIFKY